MAVQWSRVVNTTIRQFIREREVNSLRNRKIPALLQKKGRISYNASGTQMDWKVQYKRAPMVAFQGGDTLEFARRDRWKTATLGWRGYSTTDSIEKSEFLANRGKEAIINVYSEIAKLLMDDIEDQWAEEFYVDGTATGNEKRMHGIESFLSNSGAVAGNGNATPSATYAGLSCVPGNYGGTWGTTAGTDAWPLGKGSSHYDFWSPIIIDYSNTLFSATATWAANAISAIAYGIIKSQKSKSAKGMLDVIFLEDELYRVYVDLLRAKERLTVNKTADAGLLTSLGFTNVVSQDGVEITWEYGTPAAVGYGLNIDEMELKSQQGQLFVPEGPDFDISTKSWRFSIDMFGNIKWNPKFQCKFAKVT